MTQTMIYWISRLDEIKSVLNGFGVLATTVAVLSAIVCIISFLIRESNREFGEDDRDFVTAQLLISKFKKPFFYVIVGAAFLALAQSFIPTSKVATAMYVIPMIVDKESCEKISSISKDFIDVTAEWLKDIKETNKKIK